MIQVRLRRNQKSIAQLVEATRGTYSMFVEVTMNLNVCSSVSLQYESAFFG